MLSPLQEKNKKNKVHAAEVNNKIMFVLCNILWYTLALLGCKSAIIFLMYCLQLAPTTIVLEKKIRLML